jgi:hypothetical protein
MYLRLTNIFFEKPTVSCCIDILQFNWTAILVFLFSDVIDAGDYDALTLIDKLLRDQRSWVRLVEILTHPQRQADVYF